jgi:2-polyprenyl-6-methoxyphenol hydroxylase-like FAD-dependent oxidoreductase
MSWHADHDFTVTISGGSVAGLCNAITLRKLGATVRVHERVPGPMMTRGAGIVVQNELMRLLEENGAGPLPFTSCRGRRYLNPDGGDGVLQEMPQEFTSWEAIHAALRAAVPDECYRAGSEVVTVSQTGSKVSATLGDGSVVESDLFVAADGSGSAIRRKMLPDIEARYAGYVAWRGTLDESNVPLIFCPFSTTYSPSPKPAAAATCWRISSREATAPLRPDHGVSTGSGMCTSVSPI